MCASFYAYWSILKRLINAHKMISSVFGIPPFASRLNVQNSEQWLWFQPAELFHLFFWMRSFSGCGLVRVALSYYYYLIYTNNEFNGNASQSFSISHTRFIQPRLHCIGLTPYTYTRSLIAASNTIVFFCHSLHFASFPLPATKHILICELNE